MYLILNYFEENIIQNSNRENIIRVRILEVRLFILYCLYRLTGASYKYILSHCHTILYLLVYYYFISFYPFWPVITNSTQGTNHF